MEAKIVKTKSKTLSRLLRSVKALNNQSVEVGHFKSSGKHYSGMTYPELLLFWAIGVQQEGTAGYIRQDVRAQFVFEYLSSGAIRRDNNVNIAIQDWASNALVRGNPAKFLDIVGKTLQTEYKATFNKKQGPHMNGTATPLFETGELAGSTAYRTSRNKAIKEG